MDNIILVDIDLSTTDFISGFESMSSDAIPTMEYDTSLPFCFNFIDIIGDYIYKNLIRIDNITTRTGDINYEEIKSEEDDLDTVSSDIRSRCSSINCSI